MTDLTTILASLLLSLQAQPAETAATQPAPEPAAVSEEAAEKNDDDKMICRRTAVIGSKFKKKICATKREWETLAQRSSENAREMQRRGKGVEPVN